MFKKRTNASAYTADQWTTGTSDGPATVAHRAFYGPTRAVMTLLGGAAAIVLIWLATQVSAGSNGGYWAEYGLLAAAGLALAFSQLLGGWTKWGMPRISPTVFVVGFLPVLVVGGWILLAHQPHTGFFRGTVRGWSGDLGVRGLVDDFKEMLPALSVLIGLTFGFSFDTTGPRLRRTTTVPRQKVEPAPTADDRRAADAPLTAEREVAIRDGDRQVVRTGTTPGGPDPEPAPRTAPPDETA